MADIQGESPKLFILGHAHTRSVKAKLPPRDVLVVIDEDGVSEPVDAETADASGEFGYFIVKKIGDTEVAPASATFSPPTPPAPPTLSRGEYEAAMAARDSANAAAVVAPAAPGASATGSPDSGDAEPAKETTADTDAADKVADADTGSENGAADSGDTATDSAAGGESGAGTSEGAVAPASTDAPKPVKVKAELEWGPDDGELAGKVRTLPDGEWREATPAEIKARAKAAA